MDPIEQLHDIMRGVDQDECENEDGWWPNSAGAEFGASKLAELEALIRSLL